MNRKQALLSLAPLGMVFALLWRFYAVSAQLPARMATHFGFDGRPNGWQSADIFIWVAGSVLISTNVLIIAAARKLGPGPARQFVRAVQWVVTGCVTWLLWQVIDYNLAPKPIPVWPMLLIPIVIMSTGGWWAFANHEQQSLRLAASGESVQIIAEEQHRSLAQLWFVGVPSLVPLVLLFNPNIMARAVALLLLCLLSLVGLFVYRGFLYRVTARGIEVRGFGMLLNFVPRTEIRTYDVESCRPLMDFDGWGIRYTGTGKAYIWGGNKVVRIRTRRGEVMLGHSQPERLVSDLDRMMQAA